MTLGLLGLCRCLLFLPVLLLVLFVAFLAILLVLSQHVHWHSFDMLQ